MEGKTWPNMILGTAALFAGVLNTVTGMAGGYLDAPLARVLPHAAVRIIVIAVGATMSTVFFWRSLG